MVLRSGWLPATSSILAMSPHGVKCVAWAVAAGIATIATVSTNRVRLRIRESLPFVELVLHDTSARITVARVTARVTVARAAPAATDIHLLGPPRMERGG